MIPKDFITEWRAHAPWTQDRQVEQGLVISRENDRELPHGMVAKHGLSGAF